MPYLRRSFKTSIEAVNSVLTEITHEITAYQVDYLPGKNEQDPNDLHIAVWMLMNNNIYCYYINNENNEWLIRKCGRQEFTSTRFTSCPLHFLKAVDLKLYDPDWVEAVRQYHRGLYTK